MDRSFEFAFRNKGNFFRLFPVAGKAGLVVQSVDGRGGGKNQDVKNENKRQNDHARSGIHDTSARFFIKGNSIVDRWHFPLILVFFYITPGAPRSSPINKQILTCTSRRIRSESQYRCPILFGFSGQLLSSLAFIALKMELHWRSNPIGKVRKNLPLWKILER